MDLQRLGGILRVRRGRLSIKTVAKQCRISARTYRLAELGRRRPQIRTCYRLAGFLDLPPEEIMRLAGYRATQDSIASVE